MYNTNIYCPLHAEEGKVWEVLWEAWQGPDRAYDGASCTGDSRALAQQCAATTAAALGTLEELREQHNMRDGQELRSDLDSP